MRSNHALEHYLGLRYEVVIRECEDNGERYFRAEIPDLPGCVANARTREELWERIAQSKEEWLKHALEHGLQIPEPKEDYQYSGRVLLRLSKSLHRYLKQESKREGVSLNHFIVSILERARGQREAPQRDVSFLERHTGG